MPNLGIRYAQFQQQFLHQWRSGTTQALLPFTTLLLRLRIPANALTVAAIIMGIMSAVFFENHSLFILFILLHLAFDILDGSLARRQGSTLLGRWLDYCGDSSLVIILGIRAFFSPVFTEHSALLSMTLLFYLVHHLIFIMGRMRSPIMYGRSWLVFFFVFKLYLIGIGAVLILSTIGLVLQIFYFAGKK